MTEPLLSDEHYNLFGRITHGYASSEWGLKFLLAAMLKLDISIFLIVSEPYGSQDLRNVLKSIAKWSTFENDEEFEQIIGLVGRLKSYGKIRNFIAHNRWTQGKRVRSIRPIAMNIRSGKAATLGYSDDDEDYVIEELAIIADGTFKLDSDIKNFIKSYGYAEIIEQKMNETGA